jgi:hypothetical protein
MGQELPIDDGCKALEAITARGGAYWFDADRVGCGYGPFAKIVRAVSSPLTSAASTVPMSGPA